MKFLFGVQPLGCPVWNTLKRGHPASIGSWCQRASFWSVRVLCAPYTRFSRLESQRDSVPKPRVARNELPWGIGGRCAKPQRGCAFVLSERRNPVWGWFHLPHSAQGSSFLATLGWRTQSLWDWGQQASDPYKEQNLLRLSIRPLIQKRQKTAAVQNAAEWIITLFG